MCRNQRQRPVSDDSIDERNDGFSLLLDDLSSDEDEEKSKEFALRIPRVDVKKDKKARAISSSDDGDDNEGVKAKTTKKRSSKKPAEKTEKKNEEPAQMTHLKKLLRVSGIRFRLKNTELDAFPSDAEKIKYLTSLLKAEGLNGKSEQRRDFVSQFSSLSEFVAENLRRISSKTRRGERFRRNSSDDGECER